MKRKQKIIFFIYCQKCFNKNIELYSVWYNKFKPWIHKTAQYKTKNKNKIKVTVVQTDSQILISEIENHQCLPCTTTIPSTLSPRDSLSKDPKLLIISKQYNIPYENLLTIFQESITIIPISSSIPQQASEESHSIDKL